MHTQKLIWAQWDKTQSRDLLAPFICVCIALCTIVAHNIVQNRPDNFSPLPSRQSPLRRWCLFEGRGGTTVVIRLRRTNAFIGSATTVSLTSRRADAGDTRRTIMLHMRRFAGDIDEALRLRRSSTHCATRTERYSNHVFCVSYSGGKVLAVTSRRSSPGVGWPWVPRWTS